MSRLVETLKSGRILLMDGAMGTELQRAGMRVGECYEAWNLSHPDRVRAIHQAYANAGAEVLLDEYVSSQSAVLARHGLQDRCTTSSLRECRSHDRRRGWIASSLRLLGRHQA